MKTIEAIAIMLAIAGWTFAACDGLRPLRPGHDAGTFPVDSMSTDAQVPDAREVDMRLEDDARDVHDALPCSKMLCKVQCLDGGVHPGTGPWSGCWCAGYECLERGPVACSVNDLGCVVAP